MKRNAYEIKTTHLDLRLLLSWSDMPVFYYIFMSYDFKLMLRYYIHIYVGSKDKHKNVRIYCSWIHSPYSTN